MNRAVGSQKEISLMQQRNQVARVLKLAKIAVGDKKDANSANERSSAYCVGAASMFLMPSNATGRCEHAQRTTSIHNHIDEIAKCCAVNGPRPILAFHEEDLGKHPQPAV